MKILSSEQIKAVDAATITNEPVSPIELMERAALACVKRILKLKRPGQHVHIFCGMGNNGGDGLAITRMLSMNGVVCEAYLIKYSDNLSDDALTNYNRLKEKYVGRITEVNKIEDLQEKNISNGLLIDAIFGTGLNKPAEGLAAEVISHLNKSGARIVSIDVPSGLYTDKSSAGNVIVNSSLTLTFQFPKLAFLLPGSQSFVPEFEILNIGLNEKAISEHSTNYFYVTANDIASLLKPRNKFSHKGTFGHALLMAGSTGKSGAAVIAAKACLRSGAGLLTIHSNKDTLNAVLAHLPEAMGSSDWNPDRITELENPGNFDAIGFGPGIGTHEDTALAFKKLLQYYAGKLVIDADGLNILSENKTWLTFLPPSTILTPHPGEFERLTEKHNDDFDKLKTLKQFSIKHNCIVVLKGAHSVIAMPDGNLFFNSSGNPALAKGGTGDGLTGIILGLLARGYNAPQAALIGTFIHGYAADLLILKRSVESLLISDVIEQLPKAFKRLEK